MYTNSAVVLLLGLATSTVIAQQCTTTRDPKHPLESKKLVCGRRGVLTKANNARVISDATLQPVDCASECLSDPSCASFSYNGVDHSTPQCALYPLYVRSMGFKRAKTSNDIFYHQNCWIKSGDCGLSSGGFEAHVQSAAPWSTAFTDPSQGSTSVNTYANGEPSDGAAGETQYLQLELKEPSNTFTLAQDVTLLPNTQYAVSFAYAVVQADTNSFWTLTFSYDGQMIDFSRNLQYDSGTTQTYQHCDAAHSCGAIFRTPVDDGSTFPKKFEVVVAAQPDNAAGTAIPVNFDTISIDQ